MVPSEYWKRLEDNFRKTLFPRFPKNNEISKKKSSSLFQFFEETIASTETNDILKESFDTQLFAARKFKGVALSRGLHTHLPQKDIEKKVNLTEESQDAK